MPSLQEVVLITGAGSNERVGYQLAAKFHAEGKNVIIHYNTADEGAKELCKRLNEARPNSATILRGNFNSNTLGTVTKEMMAQAMEQAATLGGRLNVLVNSASLFEPSIAGEINLEQCERLNRVNAVAPLLLTQAFSAELKKLPSNPSGSVINISDVFTDQPSEVHAAYQGSKKLLEQYTTDSAATFSNLHVTAIQPGAMLAPVGVTLSKEAEIKYEGIGALWNKIVEILKTKLFNGRTVKAVKGMTAYPANFFSAETQVAAPAP